MNAGQHANTQKQVGYAKLPYAFLKKFGKGELSLTGTGFDVLIAVHPFVDHDLRIIEHMETIRRHLHIQPAHFQLVIEELLRCGYLVKKGNHFYSGVHILSTGSGQKEESYAPVLAAYQSAHFRSFSLNKKRLFVHFSTMLAFNRLNGGSRARFAIEELYRNRIQLVTHKKLARSVSYLKTAQEVIDLLAEFVTKGFITVQLDNHTEQVLSYDMTEEAIKKTLATYCDKAAGKRTSFLKASKHYIKIALQEQSAVQVSNIASKTEFSKLCEDAWIDKDVLKENLVNIVVGYKKQLFSAVGEKGLNLYRAALEHFFEQKGHLIAYYNMTDKLANYFLDFYLLEEAKKTIVSYAVEKIRVAAAGEDAINDWTPEEMEQLLRFYTHHASHNHIVLLDEALEEATAAVEWKETDRVAGKDCYVLLSKKMASPDTSAWEKIADILMGILQSVKAPLADAGLSYLEIGAKAREWAREGVFIQKERIERAVEQARNTVHLVEHYFARNPLVNLRDMRPAVQISEHAVPFFNWLDE